MKKLWLAATIAMSGSVIVNPIVGQQIEASAKSYDMSANFAKDLRHGTMPRLNGKVGMTYKTVKKKEPKGKAFISDRFNFYELKDATKSRDLYGFSPKDKMLNSDKVTIILRSYDYLISSKSVEKHFGKPYKAIDSNDEVTNSYVYKTGKYYTLVFPDKRSGTTEVYVGTKSAILDSMVYQKIFR